MSYLSAAYSKINVEGSYVHLLKVCKKLPFSSLHKILSQPKTQVSANNGIFDRLKVCKIWKSNFRQKHFKDCKRGGRSISNSKKKIFIKVNIDSMIQESTAR